MMTSGGLERAQPGALKTKSVGVRASLTDEKYGEWLVLPKNT
jgi:hypothetical protein